MRIRNLVAISLVGYLVVWGVNIAHLTGLANAQSMGGANIDLSPYALKSQVPVPAGSAPVVPAGTGSTGTPGTYTPPDAAQRLVVQRATVNTDGSGNFSLTWQWSFQSSTPLALPFPINAVGSQPIICNTRTRNANTVTGFCWVANTLSISLAALPIIGNIFNNGAATVPVMVVGAEPTQ